MKNLFFLIPLLAITMTGCISVATISTTSGLNSGNLSGIPADSEIVIVEKENSTADVLFEEVITILLSKGHRIDRDDKKRYYITTEEKNVGKSTLQRMTLVIHETDNKAVLRITTEWKEVTEAIVMLSATFGVTAQSQWSGAKWKINRLGIAFAESVAIASEIKNGVISYE